MKERKKIRQALWHRPELIKRLFSDKDWQSFSNADKLEDTQSKDLLRHIQMRLGMEEQIPRSKNVFHLYWPGIKAIAATFLPLIVAFALWKLSEKDADKSPLPLQTVLSAPPHWQTSVNTSKKRIHVHLPDSSEVFLYPGSSLTYLENFAGSYRDVYLKGKALFIIEQDKSKPFSVYAGGIKTTALGTSFTINTEDKINKTLITLHTGKVRLQPIQNSGPFSKKILLPGQSFAYDRIAFKEIKIKEGFHETVPESFYEKTGNIIQFKNVPLDKVLGILRDEYVVSIQGEATNQVKSISYTGEIDLEKENIAHILHRICLLNELELEGDTLAGFIVSSYSNTIKPITNN